MENKQSLLSALRKRWYVLLPVLLVVGGLVWFLATSDMNFEALLSEWGYAIILFLTFLEGETIVIIAGAMSETLELSPPIIALCAFCGSFTSDQVMFSLGKYKGEPVLRYFPRVAANMERAAKLFKKYDTALILGFRFVYGVRNVTPILLGISGVSHKKFFFLNFIGAGVWALTFTYGGVYAGKAFTHAMEKLGHGILYGLLGVLVLGAAVWFLRARSNVRRAKKIAVGERPAVPRAAKRKRPPSEREERKRAN